MTRLLLVEDDTLIGEMIRLNLQQEGYRVEWCTDGNEAVERVVAATEEVVGDLTQPNTGVLFAVPVAAAWGLPKHPRQEDGL